MDSYIKYHKYFSIKASILLTVEMYVCTSIYKNSNNSFIDEAKVKFTNKKKIYF